MPDRLFSSRPGPDLGGSAHDDVGTAVGLGEQLVEVGLERVAEQQRPGQERDAEHDGKHAAGQPSLVAPRGPIARS